jgi:hypothetical protein
LQLKAEEQYRWMRLQQHDVVPPDVTVEPQSNANPEEVEHEPDSGPRQPLSGMGDGLGIGRGLGIGDGEGGGDGAMMVKG